MEILPHSGLTLGYSSDMIKITVDKLMTQKLWKELRNKLLLYLLILTNKPVQMIWLIGLVEKKFSQSILKNSMDFSDTNKFSFT